MKLMNFMRPSATAPVNGGPTPIMFQESSNSGNVLEWIHERKFTFGNASNLPLSPCSPTPMTGWMDEFPEPSVIQVPNNPALYTVLYGERFSCPSPSAAHTEWQIVTFNGSSVFTGNGLNLPLPQVLDFNTISTNPCVTGSANPHTAYSDLVKLNATQAMMFYECGTTAPLEDIYGTVISYPVGETMTSVTWNGGVAIQ